MIFTKIKVDFVTNSSSESFTIVFTDTTVVVAAVTAALALINSLTSDALTDAANIANEIADSTAADAILQEAAAEVGLDSAKKDLDDANSKLNDELKGYQDAWKDSEKTADKTDPGYDKLKQQYDDYMNYLKDQMKENDYKKQLIDYEKAKKNAEDESKTEWIRQRQADLIAAKEEAALLNATLKGYGSKGYDTKDIETRLKQLSDRDKELSGTLAENNASINYTAADRGSIGPSKEFDQINNEQKAIKEKFEAEKKQATADRCKELDEKMKQALADQEATTRSANRWDTATKIAEGVQYGADMAIEGLSNVTGPAGKQIKLIYKASKSVATGMGEGMADPQNAGKHLIKGIAGAATEVIKDKLGESPWKSAIVNTGNEAIQGGLEAGIKGKNVMDGVIGGAKKGIVDSAADKGLDMIKNKLPIPKGSSVDVHDNTISNIWNNNPLKTGLAKTITREGVGDKAKDFIKGAIVDKVGESSGAY